MQNYVNPYGTLQIARLWNSMMSYIMHICPTHGAPYGGQDGTQIPPEAPPCLALGGRYRWALAATLYPTSYLNIIVTYTIHTEQRTKLGNYKRQSHASTVLSIYKSVTAKCTCRLCMHHVALYSIQ